MSGFVPLTQDQLFADFSTVYADAANIVAQLDAASTVGAIGKGNARIGERLDTQVEYVASLARLSTSSASPSTPGVSDRVASFAAPHGVYPIMPTYAQTTVTISTASPVTAAFPISPGLIVTTESGIRYVLIVDASQTGWNGAAYVIQPGSQSVSGTVRCLIPGSAGNIEPGAINGFVSTTSSGAATSLESVTNPDAVRNGTDGETDAAFILRFTTEVASGRVSTNAALLSAVASVRTGLTYQIGEYINPDGTSHVAHFSLIVDILGSAGGPGSTLLNEVAAAIDGGTGPSGTVYPQRRGAGTTRSIVGPTEVPIKLTAALNLRKGAVGSVVVPAAQAALSSYLNNFPLSTGVSTATIVPYSEIIAQLLEIPGVEYPSNITIAAGSGTLGYADLSVGFASRPVAGTLTFTTA